jgi:hypothetical protein
MYDIDLEIIFFVSSYFNMILKIYRMANSPDGEDKIAGNLVNATLLLWQIGLHDPCHTINER